MDHDWLRNVSNFILVEPNRIRDWIYAPASYCYLLTFCR